MSWTLLLCEGGHDQLALEGFARECLGWTTLTGGQSGLPQRLQPVYPTAFQDRTGVWRHDRAPTCLVNNGFGLVIRSLRGISDVLGAAGPALVGELLAGLDAIGIFVDADDQGVAARQQSARDRYSVVLPHAAQVVAGQVVAGPPRVGLWVAPTNSDPGELTDMLVRAARIRRPEFTARAEEFHAAEPSFQAGNLAAKSGKIVTGIIGQADAPAGSLATALTTHSNWHHADLLAQAPFGDLRDFLNQLTGVP